MIDIERSRRKHGGLSLFGLKDIGANDNFLERKGSHIFPAWKLGAIGSVRSKDKKRDIPSEATIVIADKEADTYEKAHAIARTALHQYKFAIADVHLLEHDDEVPEKLVTVVITEIQRRKI